MKAATPGSGHPPVNPGSLPPPRHPCTPITPPARLQPRCHQSRSSSRADTCIAMRPRKLVQESARANALVQERMHGFGCGSTRCGRGRQSRARGTVYDARKAEPTTQNTSPSTALHGSARNVDGHPLDALQQCLRWMEHRRMLIVAGACGESGSSGESGADALAGGRRGSGIRQRRSDVIREQLARPEAPAGTEGPALALRIIRGASPTRQRASRCKRTGTECSGL